MILEALPIGVYAVNREGKVILWSAGAEKLTGYFRQDVLGRLSEADLLDQGNQNALGQEAREQTAQASFQGLAPITQVSVRCKSGHHLVAQMQSVFLRDDLGKMLGTIRVFGSNSPAEILNRRQDKLGAYGCLDPTTGVLNHSMIQARLKESLDLHALYPVPFAVLCYQIDTLKNIGERCGHAAVDAVLRMGANAMENGLRPTDFLGRWQEQEFLAILPECGEGDLLKVADRLRKLVEKAGVVWWGDTLHATVSIGATVVRDNDTVSSLVGRAVEGYRQASKAGGNRVIVIGSDNSEAFEA